MKNSTLRKKLSAYASVAGAVLASAGTSDAQIVYTDVNPDASVTGAGGNYDLDLNNDGTVDFKITTLADSSSGVAIRLYPQSSNSALAHSGSFAGYFYASALGSGAPIGPGGSFMHGGSVTAGGGSYLFNNTQFLTMASIGYYFGGTYGDWIGVNDMYLGLKFQSGGNTFYGWARLDADALATTITVKDYAYESTAATSINAGAGSVGIAEVNTNGAIKIFSYDKNVYIINNGANADGMKIQITNMLGQQVINTTSNQQQVRLNASDFASGIYMVSVTTGNQVTAHQVQIQ